jgi:hypothetical protein
MQAPSLPFNLGFGGDNKRNSSGETNKKSPRGRGLLPFDMTFLGGGGGEPKRHSLVEAEQNGEVAAQTDAENHKSYRFAASTIDATHAQNVSVQLQIKQSALENTLSDTMVEKVHLQEQLQLCNDKLQEANAHIEEHVARENVMLATIEGLEDLVRQVQHEMEERLDVEELVGYRSYAQKREKEVKSRLDSLQDLTDRQDVIIKDQASEIAWLKNELDLRTADLEVALNDLRTSANREWTKHRHVCMEIGGVYIDFNHKDQVGLSMDRSAKYGPEELGMTGVGLKLGSVYPFDVQAVHPGSRTADGLPAIFHEGDKLVAVENVSCENLTKADLNGLIIGPLDTTVNLKIIRGLEGTKTLMTFEMQRLTLDPKIETRPVKRANRKVSTYGKFVKAREFEFHLPPTGTELVGDEPVWETLLLEGKTVPEHPLAFTFGDKMFHQPTFLEGQDVHGKPVCCVWDVNTGDVYYRGVQGPPVDEERIRQRNLEKQRVKEEAEAAAEERRVKMAEMEAKMRAQVEMRAKMEAAAKLKIEREGQMKEELLEQARAEIESRLLATGTLPDLTPLPTPTPSAAPSVINGVAPAKPEPAAPPKTDAKTEIKTVTTPKETPKTVTTPKETPVEPPKVTPKGSTAAPATASAPATEPAASEATTPGSMPVTSARSMFSGMTGMVGSMSNMFGSSAQQLAAEDGESAAADTQSPGEVADVLAAAADADVTAASKQAESGVAKEEAVKKEDAVKQGASASARTASQVAVTQKQDVDAAKKVVDLSAEEQDLEEEIARMAAEEAAKRAAEQLGKLKEAKVEADKAAAAAPKEEVAEEDEPSEGAGGGTSGGDSQQSPSY